MEASYIVVVKVVNKKVVKSLKSVILSKSHVTVYEVRLSTFKR